MFSLKCHNTAIMMKALVLCFICFTKSLYNKVSFKSIHLLVNYLVRIYQMYVFCGNIGLLNMVIEWKIGWTGGIYEE